MGHAGGAVGAVGREFGREPEDCRGTWRVCQGSNKEAEMSSERVMEIAKFIGVSCVTMARCFQAIRANYANC